MPIGQHFVRKRQSVHVPGQIENAAYACALAEIVKMLAGYDPNDFTALTLGKVPAQALDALGRTGFFRRQIGGVIEGGAFRV